MLGIPDFWIWSVYVLCILSALLCIVYGILNWNKGKEIEVQELEEESKWKKTEKEIEESL